MNKKKSKIIFQCPICGSNNIIGWIEKVYEENYYLNPICKKGSYLSKKKIPYSKHLIEDTSKYGYKCEDCGEWCNENFSSEWAKAWRKEIC